MERCKPLPLGLTAFESALKLVENHHLQLWDAVILAISSEARAAILLSEDMQHGFAWSGVTVINPFVLTAEQRQALLYNVTMH